jgi:hypothetical protein
MKDLVKPNKPVSSEDEQWKINLYDPLEEKEPAEEERYLTLADRQTPCQEADDPSDAT